MKNKYFKLLKRLCSLRMERLFVLGTLPLQMIHLINANQSFKLCALIIDLLMFEGLAIVFKYQRKATLQELKEGTFESIIDFEDIEEEIETLKKIIHNIAQKKEIIFKSVRLPRRTDSKAKAMLSNTLFQ